MGGRDRVQGEMNLRTDAQDRELADAARQQRTDKADVGRAERNEGKTSHRMGSADRLTCSRQATNEDRLSDQTIPPPVIERAGVTWQAFRRRT